MKFNVNLKQFQEVLKKAEYCLDKKMTLPVLKSILLVAENNKLTITATDLCTTVNLYLEIDTQIEGETILDLETIKIIKKLKDDYITVTENAIISGKKTLKFSPLDLETFPKNDYNIPEKLFTLDNMKELIKIKYASGIDNPRTVFNSIVLNRDNLISTDTHRVAFRKLPFDTQFDNIIIPIKTINIIDKILGNKDNNSFDISINKNKIYFMNNDMTIASRLIEGNIPDFNQVIPKNNENTITVNRKDFLEELEFLPSINHLIVMRIEEWKMMVGSKNEFNIITEQIPILNKNNLKLDIGVNVNFIIDVLKNYEEKEVNFNFSDNRFNPFTITAGDKLDLILVLRLNDDELEGYFEVA